MVARADQTGHQSGSDDRLEVSNILVVDDSAKNRLAIRAALDEVPHPILEAGSGQEALRILLERKVAVLLLDVRMPTMDGYETARLIRERPKTSDVPIIFITAYEPDDYSVLEAYRLGAVDFLFKPLQPEILRAKVSVFVQLQQNAAKLARQAQRLREHDRRRHEQELDEQRRKLESVSLRRQMDEQQRVNARLKEADRRKDEFLAILGHELRNPLVPLVAGLELFKRLKIDDPVVARAQGAMERQLHHLVRLVDDLLDVSRITSGRIELDKTTIDARDVIEQSLAIARPLAQNRELELVLELGTEPIWVHGDAVRLTQALSNVLNNAVRFTEPPGTVSVMAGRRNQVAAIQVRDTGRGMDAALLHRAFELFAQERPGGGGLGIGLALARQLVEQHNGKLIGRSDGPGTGSTFELQLPLAPAPGREGTDAVPAAELVVDPSAPAPLPLRLRIVVAEDDYDLRDVVGDILREWGHDVQLAGTGREALDLILASPPDVAVVDIGLPDMDGYAVAQRVRATWHTSPPRLIAMTGFGQRRDRKRALAAGFDEHITKPPDLDALRQMLGDTPT